MSWRQKYSTPEQRRELVARWKSSGVSQAEFCRVEDLPEWALSAWKRRYAEPKASRPKSAKRAKKALSASSVNRKLQEAKKYRQYILDAQTASGLSVGEFCRQNSIRVADFNRWRKRADSETPETTERKTSTKSTNPETAKGKTSTESANPFVRVRIEEAQPAPAVDSSLEIILPGGSKIRVHESSSLDLLFKVFNVLEGKC